MKVEKAKQLLCILVAFIPMYILIVPSVLGYDHFREYVEGQFIKTNVEVSPNDEINPIANNQELTNEELWEKEFQNSQVINDFFNNTWEWRGSFGYYYKYYPYGYVYPEYSWRECLTHVQYSYREKLGIKAYQYFFNMKCQGKHVSCLIALKRTHGIFVYRGYEWWGKIYRVPTTPIQVSKERRVPIRGYYRKDGTYVRSHSRRFPR